MIDIWNVAILDPVLNGLIALSTLLWNNFGLAIIVLTVAVRLILLPLTFRQTRSTVAMQALQPKLQEIQKKYARNQQQLQKEMMKLYKEAGINPLGCMWPMLIQMPIWIALYQSIMHALAASLCMGHGRPGDPAERRVHWPPFVSTRSYTDIGYTRRCDNVGAAEDGHATFHKPAATADVQHDNPDDAYDVRIFHSVVPEWSGSLLGCIKYHWHRSTIFRRPRLGLFHHAIVQASASDGASRTKN
jgi:YidC/Oxa1 family membrane protein insertase